MRAAPEQVQSGLRSGARTAIGTSKSVRGMSTGLPIGSPLKQRFPVRLAFTQTQCLAKEGF
jgi:hypothetical protein